VVTQDLCAKVIISECFLLNKIWQQMHTKHWFEPCKHGSRNPTKSTLEDFLFLLESLKKERATMSLKFIHKSLSEEEHSLK